MSTVQWYSEFELQFNYQHDFMGRQHSAEPEKGYARHMTGTCNPGPENIHLVYTYHIFLLFGISF